MLQVCAVDFTAFHFLRPLFVGARAEGWHVTFACGDGPWAARLRDEGFDHWPIHMSRSASPSAQLRSILELGRMIHGKPPSLIHTHTPVGGLVGRGAALAWKGPVVHTFHGLPFENATLSRTERAFLLAERVLSKRTTFFFSQARADADRAVTLGIARRRDLLVIGNGVDLARFAPNAIERAATRQALDLPPDAVVAIVVARLVREKGLIELADAAASLASESRLHVLVVGEALPTDRTSVVTELDHHPVVTHLGPRWRRLGHRIDVPDLLRAADMFILPTYREGLPRSIIEAMAAGLPIVATSIPACRELVQEETGILVAPRDSAALAGAMQVLVSNPSERRAMGERAYAAAQKHHDERRIVQTQLAVLGQMA